MTDVVKSNQLIELFKAMLVPITLVLALAGGVGIGAACWSVRAAVIESVRADYIERVFEDVKLSQHYSASTLSEFMRAINTLSALRSEIERTAGHDETSLDAKLRELQLEDRIMQAERAVTSHPLAIAASRRTVFEEFVLKNNIGGAL